MRLTKKLENEILELYNKYWDAYLNGKMRIMSSLMDENCHVIGSGMGEVFKNKKDAVKYYSATADQISGKSEVRNKNINMISAGSNILIIEESEFFVLIDKSWTFYGQARISTLFCKSKNKWKIIQQHGSLPDSRTGGGEQVNTDKIKEENLRLKEAIKRRTIELENKNRELEIEASLEKVRAVAMGMNKPDDLLNICEVLFKEFHSFGFGELRNAMINIHNDEKKTFLNYDYSDKIRKSINHLEYNIHPVIKKQIKQIRSSDDAFSETVFKGADLKSWKAFRKKIGEKDDPRINKSTALYYYFYSIGTGSIGISTFNSIDEEKLEVLKRFRNVFKLSYQRYKDIEQAEAQAREAQIELSLERVRARAMAMHSSDELVEASDVLFQELKKMGTETIRVGIGIFDGENDTVEIWARSEINNKVENKILGVVSAGVHPVFDNMVRAWKENKPYFSSTRKGDEVKQYYETLASHLSYPARKDFNERETISCFFFQEGTLNVVSDEPLKETECQIMIRFARVFGQMYRRFLDLKKAEAQAREAQIELGLERVRARAMAMQNSSELSELVDTVFKELTKLDFALNWCIINIIDVSTLSNMVWAANPDIDKAPDSYHMKFEDYPIHDAMMKGYKARATKYIYVLEGIEKKVYDEYLFKETEFRKVPEEAQAASRAMEKYVCSFTFSNFGGLQTVGDKPLSDINLDILERFGKVFDLTYTRFNDLKQAEAQAREAQIELALERVRARTMAMQKSDELAVTSELLFQQINELGIHPWSCGFSLWHEDDTYFIGYNPGPSGKIGPPLRIPLTKDVFFNTIREAKRRGEEFFVFESEGESLAETYRYMNTLPVVGDFMRGIVKSGYELPKYQVTHCGFFLQGHLMFITLEPHPEAWDIFKRFTKVFEQTYTRFLDLQKAEAQAREAQIEAALERVRSRTMGMQKSEELKEVIQVVYEQFVHLNIHIEHTGFIMDYKARDDMHIWLADRHEVPSEVTIPYFDCAHWNSFNEAKEKGMDFFANHLTFEEKNKFYQDLFKLIPGVPEETLEYYFSCPGLAISTVLLENVGLYIENFSGIPYSDEENKTLMRFGKVFQQTYTRFNDLKQAEAQAREAQIETALERVRSRSMAMHKSEELSETAEVLFEQINLLGKIPDRMSIGIINEESKNVEFWVTDQGGNQLSHEFFFSLDEPTSIVKIYNAWKERKDSFVVDLTGKKLQDWLLFVKENAKLPIDETKIIGRRVQQAAFFSQGFLLLTTHEPVADEIMNLLVRFAKVFDQTYRRFLDLQKAEAQAREAQIEVALERVRARTMAMHKGDELADTAILLFEQITELSIIPRGCGFLIMDEESESMEDWSANLDEKGKASIVTGTLAFDQHPMISDVVATWQKEDPYFIGEIHGEDLQKYYKAVTFKESTSKNIQDQVLSKVNSEFTNSFYFDYGMMYVLTQEAISENEIDIMLRFAKVFKQTYTRFLDLQKAEAQAREAQIEAALEKVRSRTMAMQRSEELSETSFVLFQQFAELGVVPNRFFIGILNEEEDIFDLWITEWGGTMYSQTFKGNLEEPLMWKKVYEAWKQKDRAIVVDINGEDLLKWNEYLKSIDFPVASRKFVSRVVNSCAIFSKGFISITTPEITSRETVQLLERFASVFDGTYTRFLDLKNAEAQAKEAQIAVALERVRSRTMAMHQSDELAETAAVVFKQLMNLGIEPNRIYIAIIKDETGIGEFWITNEDGSKVSSGFTANLNENRSFQKMYRGWKEQKISITIDMQGKELEEYFKHLSSLNVPFKGGLSQKRRVQNIAYFSRGFIGIASPDSQLEETTDLLKRFAAVFNLTYTRFNDLQQAEAQNKIIQAENDRKTQELEEARQLQLSMLPKELPNLPNLDIAVYMQTATEVGGDYYDFQVGLDGTLITVIGDATGHGMKAGTVVTITKSLFNSMAANESILGTFDKISQVLKGMKFRHLSMCLIMIKIRGNRLSMSSAAMPPALIYRAKEKSVEEIFLKAMPLGTMKKFPYKKIESHLDSGDRILLYSDGLPELANENNEMYGYDKIIAEFHSVGEKEPEEIVDHLKESASQWLNGKEPDDDVTFVVIKVK